MLFESVGRTRTVPGYSSGGLNKYLLKTCTSTSTTVFSLKKLMHKISSKYMFLQRCTCVHMYGSSDPSTSTKYPTRTTGSSTPVLLIRILHLLPVM